MKPSLFILCLFFAGCQTRQGSETAAMAVAEARIRAASGGIGKQIVKLESTHKSLVKSNNSAKGLTRSMGTLLQRALEILKEP